MSAAHSPEFSSGAPQIPSETALPAAEIAGQPEPEAHPLPEFPTAETTQPEPNLTETTPASGADDEWVVDPFLGRIRRIPTEPHMGDNIAKGAATGSFPIIKSEASESVETTPPSFDDIILPGEVSIKLHPEAPLTGTLERELTASSAGPETLAAEAASEAPEPEIITGSSHTTHTTEPSAGRHALRATAAELPEPATEAPFEQSEALAAPQQPELAADSEPAQAEQTQPEQAQTEAPQATTPVTLGGRIQPVQPTTGRHTLTGTLEAPENVPTLTPPSAGTVTNAAPEAPTELLKPLPAHLKRVPGAHLWTGLRAQQAGMNVDGVIRGRRAARETAAAQVQAGLPIGGNRFAGAIKGLSFENPVADDEAPANWGSFYEHFDKLVGSTRAALQAAGLITTPTSVILTAILEQGVNARGEATHWPENIPVTKPDDLPATEQS